MSMPKERDLYKFFFVFVSYESIMIYIVSGQLYRDMYRIVAYPYRPSPNTYQMLAWPVL